MLSPRDDLARVSCHSLERLRSPILILTRRWFLSSWWRADRTCRRAWIAVTYRSHEYNIRCLWYFSPSFSSSSKSIVPALSRKALAMILVALARIRETRDATYNIRPGPEATRSAISPVSRQSRSESLQIAGTVDARRRSTGVPRPRGERKARLSWRALFHRDTLPSDAFKRWAQVCALTSPYRPRSSPSDATRPSSSTRNKLTEIRSRLSSRNMSIWFYFKICN